MPASRPYRLVPAGPSHPAVQQYLRVKARRRAADPTLVALEGGWLLRHAVAAGLRAEVLFVCPERVRAPDDGALSAAIHEQGALVLEVSERVLRRMVDRDGPDGLAALVHWPPAGLADIRLDPDTLVVVAAGVELPGNLGTLIRAADACAAGAVIVLDPRLSRHPQVVRASMGTIFTTATIGDGESEVLAWLRGNGFRVVAADPAAATSYRRADYRGRTAIVLGAERTGLPPRWRVRADQLVHIPMRGVADSLNVGVAGGLLLYEALHQRT